jgi:5'-nucleotidase
MSPYLRPLLWVLGLALAGPASALHVMLTNDDGYAAPGLAALGEALRAAGHRVTVVAPLTDQSGTSARITTTPLKITTPAPGVYAVEGSPADAVWVGLARVLKDAHPDLVVSGANRGQNVGAIAHLSGTVGAATMASLNAVPAIAVSVGLDFAEAGQGFPSTLAAYPEAARFITALIARLEATAEGGPLLPAGVFLNVNCPTRPTSTSGSTPGAAHWATPGRDWGYAVGYAETDAPDTLKLTLGPDPMQHPPGATTDTARFAAGQVTVSLMATGFGPAPEGTETALRQRLAGTVAP